MPSMKVAPMQLRGRSRKDTCELVRVVGARMREARELCNLSQIEAARRLGYRNSSKLCKVESASDTQSVPMTLIVMAAKLYDVSADYLLGLTDDWESGAKPERAVATWVFEVWESARARDMGVLQRLHTKLATLDAVIATMVSETMSAQAALDQFVERNPDFEDMPVGAKLQGTVCRAADAAQYARSKMQRIQVECGVDNRVPRDQMTLKLEEEA